MDPSGNLPGMPVRSLFFDFGGTLVHSRMDLLPPFREAARRADVRLAFEEFRRANEAVWEELWPNAPAMLGKQPSFADVVHERALRRVGAEGSIERMVDCLREELLSPRWHEPFPETEPALRAARSRGLRLHLVSNNIDYLPSILRNLGWSGLFDSVTFSQEIGVSKPDPRIFRLALGRAGCAPEDAVHVGDSWEADYLGATGVGMRAVWLNRTRVAPPGPCESITDLRGLGPLLSAGLA